MAPNPRIALKNIWVAASDGDLARVRHLIEQEGMSANAPDPNTYTPMHAAASYGHINLLEYLVTQGGDVDITDEDGDTPLYTVETVETAKWLVEHGATVDRVNAEGISPSDHLEEDFPRIAAFLRGQDPAEAEEETILQPSQFAQEQVTEQLTSEMMESVRRVMERADADGHDPDEELAELVTRTVLRSMDAGEQLAENAEVGRRGDGKPTKVPKTDG